VLFYSISDETAGILAPTCIYIYFITWLGRLSIAADMVCITVFWRLARTIQHPWPQARGMLNESGISWRHLTSTNWIIDYDSTAINIRPDLY